MYEFAMKKMKEQGIAKGTKWNITFDDVQIGDYFVADHGYSMTLVTFYKVVGKSGKATLEVIRVGNKHVNDYGYGGSDVVPDDGNVRGGPFKVRCRMSPYTNVLEFPEPEYHVHAYPWDGQPEYFNNYD